MIHIDKLRLYLTLITLSPSGTKVMKKDIQVLLVDDQEVIREGLRRMLELESNLEVVGETGDANEALALAELFSPEVILMDIKMPGMNGIELTRQLKQKQPSCNVLMLTLYDEYLTQAIEAGAVGYLVKDIKREELIRSIRAVHEGRSPISLSFNRERLSELLGPDEDKQRLSLSERELTIIHLIIDGITTIDIANRLFLSQASVKRSIRLIFEKLGVRNRSEAVSECYKRNLLIHNTEPL
jgi:DNA-binding NarL/FixJ family response regulator